MSSQTGNNETDEIHEESVYSLRLFVAGTSTTSLRAITNLNKILEENLKSRYNLEIIDIYQQPGLAEQENISAVPLLVKYAPYPKRFLVGDMSDKQRVLRGLGIIHF
ncbi:circadian clock KaiB family protein [Terrimonas sp. NA20]|uniref:Circadian clock KaiB family protein n=1 Tax=Terrimonas ginsenosidimutans TaxID=2908004 RepID=A0ABS9KRX0_9BACT|nr:circadian clock KaiB family protein [Terrimonas ginsenosidimutans]MCG2615078.1 circadian clock KaiB family protein [Terrimonas ginsenosidimutans]